jgi:hypothetical protein
MSVVRAVGTAVLTATCLFWTIKAASLPHDTESDHSGKTVHIVFSNHLDIGFDGIGKQLGTDDAVINKYFDEYFQRAVRAICMSSHLMAQCQHAACTETSDRRMCKCRLILPRRCATVAAVIPTSG